MLLSGVEIDAIVTIVVAVCATISVVAWTRRGRRAMTTRTGEHRALLAEDRVTQIERALEAIAIEVERIAEGQRFTAKLLAERIEREARLGDQAAFRDPDGMRRTTPV